MNLDNMIGLTLCMLSMAVIQFYKKKGPVKGGKLSQKKVHWNVCSLIICHLSWSVR